MAGASNGTARESNNKDKSLHGLVVALAMAGTIAGSAILFAYAASDGSVMMDTTDAASAAEPEVIEKVVEKPVYIERIKYVNRTVEVEKPVYVNRTVEVEKPVYINRTVEVEKEVPVYINQTVVKEVPVYIEKPVYVEKEDKARPEETDRESLAENNDDLDGDELKDIIPKDVRDLLHNIVDDDNRDEDDEEEDVDDGDKRKGKRGGDD